jgi:hypothetical protein
MEPFGLGDIMLLLTQWTRNAAQFKFRASRRCYLFNCHWPPGLHRVAALFVVALSSGFRIGSLNASDWPPGSQISPRQFRRGNDSSHSKSPGTILNVGHRDGNRLPRLSDTASCYGINMSRSDL